MQLEATVVGTYGSIGRTLAHLVSAEDSYAARLAARPRRFRWDEAAPAPSVAELRAALESVGPELVELAGSTPEALVLEVLRDGQPVPVPGWIILAQVIDHGREHRTHIATILTQLGIEPPDMDGWSSRSLARRGGVAPAGRGTGTPDLLERDDPRWYLDT